MMVIHVRISIATKTDESELTQAMRIFFVSFIFVVVEYPFREQAENRGIKIRLLLCRSVQFPDTSEHYLSV